MNRILISISLCFLLLASPTFAQEVLGRHNSQDLFSSLKEEVAALMEENQALEEENKQLQAQYLELEIIWQQNQGQFERLQQLSSRQEESQKNKLSGLKSLENDFQRAENEILIKKSKNAYLAGKLLDFDDKNKLWKLQLQDLQFQKRDLEMELKLKKFNHEEAKRKEADELDRLKAELMQNLDKEKVILEELMTLEKEGQSYNQKIEQLTKENSSLLDQVKLIDTQLSFKTRENKTLRDKKLLALKIRDGNSTQREIEKESLEGLVAALQKEYDILNETISMSLVNQNSKTDLLKNMIEIDKENQGLRNKIDELNAKLSSANPGI